MVEWQRLRFVVAGAALLCARDAAAQSRHHGSAPPPPGNNNNNAVTAPPTFASRSNAGDVGQQRMRAGDCAGALDAFDAALQSADTPDIHRDRGLCHEKLGQPYPAIDDYRVYLTQRPGAPDSDAIRARLLALETQVGIVRPGQPGVSDSGGAEVTTSIGGETDLGEPTGGKGGVEVIEEREQLDAQADGSSLRRGTGFILGLAVGGRDFTNASFGAAELVGIDLRYSFSRLSTLMLELSIGHVSGSGTITSLSGPGIMGGYEARIPLNARVSDALLLGATFRFESLSEANGFVFSVLEPEGRFGYRHVFGPSLGLEAAFDGGAAFASVNGVSNSSTTQAVLGGHVALLLGF
jgi:hypothetical protein